MDSQQTKSPFAPLKDVTLDWQNQPKPPLGGGVETKTDEEIAQKAAEQIHKGFGEVNFYEPLRIDVAQIILSAIREARSTARE